MNLIEGKNMSIRLDKRFTRLIQEECVICGRKFELYDEIETSITKRKNQVCMHTKCWMKEQELIRRARNHGKV